MVEELDKETQQDPVPPLPKGFKVVKSSGGSDLPPLPAGYSQKKNLGVTDGSIGGTVGSSKAPSSVSIEPPNPKDNPFGIGQQFNKPPKLEAEKLDLSNTQHNAAIAEQIKTPLKKIPLTPILDNTKMEKPITEIDKREAERKYKQHQIDMETAIDNTTLKVLKQKGIVAGKGSPYYEAERKKIEEKTKPTMIGGIVINGAEATYHKDKDGNIGLDRNLGFLEGIRKGFNSAVEGEDEANAFAQMDTKQKVEYANKQMEGKPTEYMEERGGVGELVGGAAPYLVKAATAATLATAAGIAAPASGGTSLVGLAPTLTVLLTAPDMIKQGQKDEVMTRYMQLKQENPFSKDEDLMKIAEQGEISGGIVGAAEALAFTTSLKLPILKDSKDVLTTYLKGVASSAVHLGGIMSGTTAAKIAERKLEGYNVQTDKAIDEIATSFTENATAGAILNGIISGAHILPKAVKSAFKYALKDTPTSEIKTALDANVQAGRIPPEVAEQTISDIEGYKEALAKTADGLKPETQASVAGLIQARDNVAAEMATKDPTQRAVYEQKIEAYNKQIEKITETNDPLKYEIDEVTGNPIDKVAPKGEPEQISKPIELSTEPTKKAEDTKLSQPIEGVDEQGIPIGDNVPTPTEVSGKENGINEVSEGKKEGITHAAVAELRKMIELPEYEGKPTETHETLIEEAQKTIKDNKNAANEVLDKMENGGKITNKDNAIMAIYKATIDAEMAKNPTPELLQRATRLSKALDVSGTELGKALESRKLVGQEDNLTNFLLDKQAAQGTALTETQIKSEAAKYEELKITKEALEKQLEVEREQHAKDIAELGLNKAKAKAKKEAKKSKEDYKTERKETVQAARDALKKIREGGLQSTIPAIRELQAIAPHIKDYVKSLVNEGVDKLDNIVTAVHAEFKDVLEGLTQRNVLDIISGEYNEKPKEQTRNEKANTIRLLEREASLLKQLERERLNEEKAKTESDKTQSNRRIDELKEKIKEVRRQNKNREADTESPEDMSAGEIEYNAKLQKRLTEKAQKLTQDIKNKKYLEEEPAKPIFKKSRKTQLLEDKVIDLENKIRHERSKDEYNKRGKLRKGFDKVMEVLGLRRLVQSALDMSVPFRQGATMLSPRKIDVWLKGYKANLQSIFNPKKFERIMHEIRNDQMYHEMVKDNVVFNDLSSADPNLHNEDFRKSFIYKIPILSEPLKASNRSADAFLNVARIEMYKKLRNNLEKRGLTRESDPKAFRYIGNWVMAMTGRGTMHSALEKPAMNAVLGNTFYGARLMASRFNLLNPVTYLDPRIPREAKYEAMKDMVAFTTTMMTVATALSYTTGAKISLNPDDSDFLQLRYGKKVYDISGGLANYVRTGLRIAKAAYTKASGTKYEGREATDNAGKSVLNFFRNKLSPNTAYGVDAFFGGRYGNEFDPSAIYRIYPMYTEDFMKAIKEEGGLMATSTVLLPNILGIGYGSYASKGQIDLDINDLLERNLRSDGMNNEKIFNYKENGRVITDKEFDEFAKKRDEAIKKDITLLFNNGIGQTKYEDLTPEQVADEIKYIKATATREVKEELFGKHKKTTQEKRETKKLQKEHKRQYKNN